MPYAVFRARADGSAPPLQAGRSDRYKPRRPARPARTPRCTKPVLGGAHSSADALSAEDGIRGRAILDGKAAGSINEPAALSYCFGQRTVVFFPFRCTGRRSDSPEARHGESSTKRRSAPEWISSHRAFQSFSSCIFCRSSSSRTRHLPSAGGGARPSSPADRRKTSCPRSRASASAVLPKPQGR